MITYQDAQAVLRDADCLYSKIEVEKAISRLALEIAQKVGEKNPLILCVMNGGLVPTGKLITELNFSLQVDYIHATRYRGETRGGDLHWVARPQHEIRDRVLLIIDDILEEGVTLHQILEYCEGKLATFQIPRFIEFVDKLPKSEVHRIMKRYLKDQGVSEKTYDREAGGFFKKK